VNDLRERLDRLADAAAEGVEVTRPDQRQASPPLWRSRPALVAATAILVVVAVTAAVLAGRDDGDDDVTVGADGDGWGAPAGQGNGALVAVTYRDSSLRAGTGDIELRFLDADGGVIAERSLGEVPVEGAPAEAVVMGGLLQPVPAGTSVSRRHSSGTASLCPVPSRSPRPPAIGSSSGCSSARRPRRIARRSNPSRTGRRAAPARPVSTT
jgi:hypothetical protein